VRQTDCAPRLLVGRWHRQHVSDLPAVYSRYAAFVKPYVQGVKEPRPTTGFAFPRLPRCNALITTQACTS